MNSLLNAMKENDNVTTTTNGDKAYKSTFNKVMDLFAFGGSYRGHSDEDCILLFKEAFEENPSLAMKCLFYLRDVRGGQGQRHFFRVVCRWLAMNNSARMAYNITSIPEYGRWDDLYAFVDTPLEEVAFIAIRNQLVLDIQSKTPSLLAKWLKSENSSSNETRRLARKTRLALGMTSKQYRKTLSMLRSRIRVLERLMSAGEWDKIEFDKIPSRAGIIYRNAFARRDILKAKYEQFAKDKNTKVNAGTLYPCEVVRQARRYMNSYWNEPSDDTERLMINKYWDNLTDYFNNATFNGVAVVDTSGSMLSGPGTIAPIDVAIALGMYCAEKCNPNSPWHGNYITFSRDARLVPINGVDFVDKVKRIYEKNLCENTDIESVFDLILSLAIQNHVPVSDMPKNIVVISDMQFDPISNRYGYNVCGCVPNNSAMESIARRWQNSGYELPKLIFWNVNATNATLPMQDNGRVAFVSGYSPSLFEQIMTSKTGVDLMLEKLNSKRYEAIR